MFNHPSMAPFMDGFALLGMLTVVAVLVYSISIVMGGDDDDDDFTGWT